MLHKAISNLKNQDGEGEGGFTLIELLVVILIIGILAAIALPTFLGQSDKAKDSSAKSDARNVVSMIESCYSTTQDYSGCVTKAKLAGGTAPDTGGIDGLVDGAATAGTLPSLTADPVEVKVTAATAGTYTIIAGSKSKNYFAITKTTSGTSRTCGKTITVAGVASGNTSDGACNAGKW